MNSEQLQAVLFELNASRGNLVLMQELQSRLADISEALQGMIKATYNNLRIANEILLEKTVSDKDKK